MNSPNKAQKRGEDNRIRSANFRKNKKTPDQIDKRKKCIDQKF